MTFEESSMAPVEFASDDSPSLCLGCGCELSWKEWLTNGNRCMICDADYWASVNKTLRHYEQGEDWN